MDGGIDRDNHNEYDDGTISSGRIRNTMTMQSPPKQGFLVSLRGDCRGHCVSLRRLVVWAVLGWLVVGNPSLLETVRADAVDHKYQPGEHVELWVNKVGPYANPQEAYEYYTLPYCAPDTKHHPDQQGGKYGQFKLQSIGEYLGGHALRHSGHDIVFSPSQVKAESCTTEPLTAAQTKLFQQAILDRWFYQMFLDDLPVWGMVGELVPKDMADKGGKIQFSGKDDLDRLESVADVTDHAADFIPMVYTTRNLIISYNKDQIVRVDIHSEPQSLLPVEQGKSLTFTLNVHWEATTDEFHSRFERYLDHDFFKHPIHWFSVFNSFMMVLFLTGLVALILLRTLKRDYARYGLVTDLEEATTAGGGGDGHDVDDDDDDDHGRHRHATAASETKPLTPQEEAGWKQVHGDVFRAPGSLVFFAALLGTGWQLVVLTLSVILFAVLGPLHGRAVHEERGEVLTAVVVCYALSSIVAGYSSGKYFKLYYPTTQAARRLHTANAGNAATAAGQGPKTTLWQAVMALTVILLPTVTVLILSFLNAVSLTYGTIHTIPFSVIFKLFLLWTLVSIPLCIVGTMLGRHTTNNNSKLEQFPCRVNAIPRPIPEDVPWYGKPSGLIPLAGLLSFGSIFIELYYILTSLWNYKYYHVYGFLLGVYSILMIVVGMTSIIVVYFGLNAENYHWQWTAFASGASTAGYVFLYGIYYFLAKTHMHGFLQTSFYFGYMLLLSLHLGLLCGTVGHGAASRFVRAIFQNVKVD